MRKFSDKTIDRAEKLYIRGYKFLEITKRLGISHPTLSKYKKAGDWDNAKLPLFTLNDLVEDTRVILFTYLQRVLGGEEENFTRAALNIKSLVTALKELEDLAPTVSARDAVETMKNFMKWVVQQNLTEPEYILKKAQEYHDIHKDAIQD